MFRVKLKGFKKYTEEKIFELQPGINLIEGKSGSGKSTLIEAVYWVLFGKPRDVKNVFLEKEEIKKNGTSVSFWLDNYYVKRTKPPETLILKIKKEKGDKVYEGEEAQQLIYQIFGNGTEWGSEYSCFMFQGQSNILLSGTKAEKTDILKKLFFGNDEVEGQKYIERIEEIVKKYESKIEKNRNKIDTISEIIKKEKEDYSDIISSLPQKNKNEINYENVISDLKMRIKIQNELDQEKNKRNDYSEEIQSYTQGYEEEINFDEVMKRTKEEIENLKKVKDWMKLAESCGGINTIEFFMKNSGCIQKAKLFYGGYMKFCEDNGLDWKIFSENLIDCLTEEMNIMDKFLKMDRHMKEIVGNLELFKNELPNYEERFKKTMEFIGVNYEEATERNIMRKCDELTIKPLTCPNCNIELMIREGSEGNKLQKVEKYMNDKDREDVIQIMQLYFTTKNRIESYENELICVKDDMKKFEEVDEKKIKYKKTNEAKLKIIDHMNVYDFNKEMFSKFVEMKEKSPLLDTFVDDLETCKRHKNEIELINIEFLREYEKSGDDTIKYKLKNESDKLARYEKLNTKYEESRMKIKKLKEKLEEYEYLERTFEGEVLDEDFLDKMRSMKESEIKDKIFKNHKDRKDEIKSIENKNFELGKEIEEYKKLELIIQEIINGMFMEKIEKMNEIVNDILSYIAPDFRVEIDMFKYVKSKKIIKPEINIKYFMNQVEYEGKPSGGEEDRISIAFSIAMNILSNSKFMFIDESTKFLNIESKMACVEVIKKYLGEDEKYVGMVCHDTIHGQYDNIIHL